MRKSIFTLKKTILAALSTISPILTGTILDQQNQNMFTSSVLELPKEQGQTAHMSEAID